MKYYCLKLWSAHVWDKIKSDSWWSECLFLGQIEVQPLTVRVIISRIM